MCSGLWVLQGGPEINFTAFLFEVRSFLLVLLNIYVASLSFAHNQSLPNVHASTCIARLACILCSKNVHVSPPALQALSLHSFIVDEFELLCTSITVY